ncbi:hypothetical protein VF21_04898 [Pseudogymnoascus sp. 05NY08]|nr:hypothetical protein VF21_04898 [Pseudogymnoascus sp. 05NY08]
MLVTAFSVSEKYIYQNGFQSYHETEAIPGALPIAANSPQRPPYGLYAEKLSGTAFTAPQHENLQSWLYRIIPAAAHSDFAPYVPHNAAVLATTPDSAQVKLQQIPNQLRWDPFDFDMSTTWIESLN